MPSPGPGPRPGSHPAIRAMLGEAAGPEEAAMLRRFAGRPSLDAAVPAGGSPELRVRAPARLHSQLRTQARQEGRSVSAIVRDAAEEYLLAHRQAN
jgi:hypothetical protein